MTAARWPGEKNKPHKQHEDVVSEDVQVVRTRRLLPRLVHWTTCALLLLWCGWQLLRAYPKLANTDVTIQGLQHDAALKYPEVPDLVRVGTLPDDYKPDHHQDKRLIIVGDVHGNLKELKKLLKKAHFIKNRDHLVMCGDFITKGPDSIEVLEYAMDINAACVRGNHEDEVLHYYAQYHGLPDPKIAPPRQQPDAKGTASYVDEQVRDNDHDLSDDDEQEEPRKPTGMHCGGALRRIASRLHAWSRHFRRVNDPVAIQGPTDELVARILEPRHVEYLGSCPSILELGNVTRNGVQAVAVHGGLMWNIDDLELQDPHVVMRIRTALPPDWTEASEDDDGRPWTKLWNDAQSKKSKSERLQVFYGHDARSGLNIQRYTKGLDSGCVKGGKLSAIVVTHKHNGKFKEKLIQVDCD
jgi:hypothetical protein